jgi:hypothetical protein
MFEFDEGQSVSLRQDRPNLGLKAGDIGVIWARYANEPPSYEVTFKDAAGQEFDMTLAEDELVNARHNPPRSSRKSGRPAVQTG